MRILPVTEDSTCALLGAPASRRRGATISHMSQGTVAASSLGRELSLEEWFDLPEDEPGELVDGRLEDLPGSRRPAV